MCRKWKWLAVIGTFFGVVAFGYQAFLWYRWRERADAATGVALELRPRSQIIKAGEVPTLEVTLVNGGGREVVLVKPGDGSLTGRRTPLIEWSGHPGRFISICLNINDLQADEIFTLKPGESRRLDDWVGEPYVRQPGRYRVAVRYENRPQQPWSGMPFHGHDPAAMQRVQESTPVDAISNTVEIVVER